MKLSIFNKNMPVTKVIIYISFGLLFTISSGILVSPLISPILCILGAAFFILATYHIGILFAIPALMSVALMLVFENFISALSILPSLITALVAGLMLRKKSTPIETITAASIIYVISSVAVALGSVFIYTQSFTVRAIFDMLSNYVDEAMQITVDTFQSQTGLTLTNIGVITDLVKSVMVGTYICILSAVACFMYCVSAFLSRIFKDTVFAEKPFDIRPSNISSAIYLITFVIMLFSGIPNDGVKYYTTLALNLFLILTPVFLASGIYYITRIKFRVEHGNPFFLIIFSIMSFISGIFPALFIYIAICGATYSLRYNKLNSLKEKTNDSK